MTKSELTELAGNPDFIPGIYNYCDRWCERCQFASRCLVYAQEKLDSDFDDPDTRDITNAKFWRKLESVFKEMQQVITEWAEEAGIDLNAIDDKAALEIAKQRSEDAKQDPLSLSALHYADLVREWFNAHISKITGATGEEAAPNADHDIDRRDAAEVIQWYQFFIAAKLFRALRGRQDLQDELTEDASDSIAETELDDDDPFADEEFDDEEAEDFEEISGNDSDGSAKIALIAIERSANAWRAMQRALPDQAAAIMPMLLELERLRRATEKEFPHARDFMRPGFDEVLSDFLS